MSLPSGLVERRAEFVSFSSSPTHPHTQLQPAVGPQLLGSSARKYNGRVIRPRRSAGAHHPEMLPEKPAATLLSHL